MNQAKRQGEAFTNWRSGDLSRLPMNPDPRADTNPQLGTRLVPVIEVEGLHLRDLDEWSRHFVLANLGQSGLYSEGSALLCALL